MGLQALLGFLAKYGDDTKAPLSVFKAAQYFSPPKAFEMQPSASSVDSFVDSLIIH